MAQPVPYNRQFSFLDFEMLNPPATPKPGGALDSEYDAIEDTLDETLANLALIQRDDGKLRNESVHKDALNNDVLVLMGGSWNPRGFWTPVTPYEVSDAVEYAPDGKSYVCVGAHTSGLDFYADRAAGKWILMASETPVAGGWHNESHPLTSGTHTVSSDDDGSTFICDGPGIVIDLPLPGALPPNVLIAIMNESYTRAVRVTKSGVLWFWLYPRLEAIIVTKGGTEWAVFGARRWRLEADKTIFVNPVTGHNVNNDGLDASAPLLNIATAISLATSQIDFQNRTVTIQLQNGTYAEKIDFPENVNWLGGGSVLFQGDPVTPGNVLLAPGAGVDAVLIAGQKTGAVKFSGVKFGTAASHITCFSGGWAQIVGKVEFGAATGFHIVSSRGSKVYIAAAYTISGGAIAHFKANLSGHIGFIQTVAATLTGVFNFGGAFADCDLGASIHAAVGLASFVGAATGTRYNASINAVLVTEGGGANWFPGSVPGVLATGGQYT